ncbi:MAG TPA: hypothetical protein VFI39_07345 [Gemmatimonadales bacterium]|nr:hypothetical protein [Gemmatimonadales bacterium]
MTDRPTRAALAALAAPVRRHAFLAVGAATIAALAFLFGAVAWAFRLGAATGPLWVLATWALAIIVVIGAVWEVRRRLGRTDGAHIAELLEATGQWRRGSLGALLGAPAVGVSESLLGSADRAAAGALQERAAPVIRRLTERTRRLNGVAVIGAVVGVALLLWSRPLDGAAAALWRPRHAIHAVVAPVRIAVNATTVDRGDRVTVDVQADDRRGATLWLRTPGESWRATAIALDAAGRGQVVTEPLTTDLYARAVAGGRSSDTLVVRVRVPAFLGTVTVTAEYPAYLHLDPGPVPLDGDTLPLPAGTRLVTRGQATAALAGGAWSGPDGFRAEVHPRGADFSATFTPVRSGSYALALRTVAGSPLTGAAISIPVRVIPDSAPSVDIPVPGADTVVGIDRPVAMLIEARDDHGIARLEVESRSRRGDDARTEQVALPAGDPDHVTLPWALDLRGRGFLPGDTVIVVAWATDDAPAAHRARSREYRFRLATLAEALAATEAATASVRSGFDSVAAAGQSLSRQTEDLAHERARVDAADARTGGASLSFDAAARASAVAAAQAQLQRQAEGLRDAVSGLERKAAAAGIADPAWQRALEQIRQELDRALTPELRQRLADLQQAIHDLDADRTRGALQDLSAQQSNLRAALERSRELFRRAAVEGDLANLGARAEDLAGRQSAWDTTVAAARPASAAGQERSLADQADSLAAGLAAVAARVAQDGQDSALVDAAHQAHAAASEMRDAADQAGKGQAGAAQEKGRSAEQKLSPLANGLAQRRKALQSQWRADVTAALDRALTETARLSGSELDLSGMFTRGVPAATLRGRQAAIIEGTQRVITQLQQASGRNAIVSPQLAVSMVQAMLDMQKSLDALSNGVPDLQLGGAHAGDAVDGLNAAAYLLVRNRDDVAGSGSGSGMAEAMAKMKALAGQQGSLGQAAEGLLPSLGSGSAGPAIAALGGRERAIADALERLRADGQIPGAGALAEEAKDLARRLQGGVLDRPMVERQQRLFRRMLDAGRTLQGNEDDPDHPRVSQVAVGDSAYVPAALRHLPGAGAIRVPDWNDLARYSPEERRLVADYFRRLMAGGL